jgi:hypothetical protein
LLSTTARGACLIGYSCGLRDLEVVVEGLFAQKFALELLPKAPSAKLSCMAPLFGPPYLCKLFSEKLLASAFFSGRVILPFICYTFKFLPCIS